MVDKVDDPKAKKDETEEKKIDETVPGGRFEVDGKIVDSDGEPIGGKKKSVDDDDGPIARKK